MLHNSIALSFILSAAYIIALPRQSNIFSYMGALIVVFLLALYLGFLYAKKFKLEMYKQLKISTVLYYCIYQIILCSIAVVQRIFNIAGSFFNLSYQQTGLFLTAFIIIVLSVLINGIAIYYALGFGSKLGIKQIN